MIAPYVLCGNQCLVRYGLDMPIDGGRGANAERPSIASRRREFVAREIEEAAIRVFAQNGYENVTVADIAEAAGVARRTVFRYFPSKDHILRAHSERLQIRVVRALVSRPSDESAVQALCNAVLDTAEVGPDERASMLLRNRVLRQHPSGVGSATMTPEIEGKLVELVAARMGLAGWEDLRPRLVVAIVWAAADAASAHWAAVANDEPLKPVLAAAFDTVLAGLDALNLPS